MLVRDGVPVEQVLARVPGIKDVGKAFLYGYAAGLTAARKDPRDA